MELTTIINDSISSLMLFMMSKIQNLNGTHNICGNNTCDMSVVYDVKDTKFEWNSQQVAIYTIKSKSCL